MTHFFTQSDHPAPTISRLTPADVRQTSRLQRSLLPYAFFSQLGTTFIRRWHRTFIDSPYGVALVAKDQCGDIQGFLVASTDQTRHTVDVLHRSKLALAWRGALALALRPRLAVRFLRSRAGRYARRLRGSSAVRPIHPTSGVNRSPTPSPESGRGRTAMPGPFNVVGVIHAIATIDSCRGRGVGKALLAAYDRELIAVETPLVQLVTREAGGAADFYRRLGYRQTAQRLDHDGTSIIQFDHIPGLS